MLSTSVVFSLVAIAVASPVFDLKSSTSVFFPSDRIASSCSAGDSLSCHNTTIQENTCCFEAPGGLLMQTQFWDTKPSTGPSDSWTIHGLWPDNCDGTYEASCDPSRAYTNLDDLLTSNGGTDTLSFMKTYWVDINGDSQQFWQHEWSKHGTCMSTFHPSCLPGGSAKGAEAVAYFQTVVKLFKDLPTYSWLEKAGITPGSKTFTLSELTSALKSGYGQTPALDCKSGALNQISYYYNLKGSAIDGTFVPTDSPKAGSCPSSGIKYFPKSTSGGPTTSDPPSTTSDGDTPTSTTTSPPGTNTPTSTSSPGGVTLPARAHTAAIKSGNSLGGLLSAGTLATSSPGTMKLGGTMDKFTITSSKGACGVSNGVLACGGASSGSFSAVVSGSSLLLVSDDGSTSFSSDDASGSTGASVVYIGSDHAQTYSLSIAAV